MTDISDAEIIFRNPRIDDGAAMWRIVKNSGVLDVNSAYLYLLLCKDFSESCIVAEHHGKVVGFVTGYRVPGRPAVIFLWQVGVDESMRGQGLGKRLVGAFLRSEGARGATVLETTVSPDNGPSRALFQAIARDLDAELKIAPCFVSSQFPEEGHEDEELFRIGPFETTQPNKLPY